MKALKILYWCLIILVSFLFLTLKLVQVGLVADWDWIWVTCPAWGSVSLAVGWGILTFLFEVIKEHFDNPYG